MRRDKYGHFVPSVRRSGLAIAHSAGMYEDDDEDMSVVPSAGYYGRRSGLSVVPSAAAPSAGLLSGGIGLIGGIAIGVGLFYVIRQMSANQQNAQTPVDLQTAQQAMQMRMIADDQGQVDPTKYAANAQLPSTPASKGVYYR